MKNSIINKYPKLYNACKKNPLITLNKNTKPTLYKSPEIHTKNGFIEKFCK